MIESYLECVAFYAVRERIWKCELERINEYRDCLPKWYYEQRRQFFQIEIQKQQDCRQQVLTMLNDIPDDLKRRMLYYRYFERMDIRTIAEKMSYSQSSVAHILPTAKATFDRLHPMAAGSDQVGGSQPE